MYIDDQASMNDDAGLCARIYFRLLRKGQLRYFVVIFGNETIQMCARLLSVPINCAVLYYNVLYCIVT